MEYQGGFTGAMSPDAVKTSIDGVMWENFSREQQPGDISATDSAYFKQGSTVGDSFIFDENVGVGDFDAIGEQEEFLGTDSWIGNKTTKTSVKFYKQVAISDEAFKADMVGKRAEIGRDIGRHARQTQDKRAILDTYGDAFSGSVHTTPDGQALASNSHTSLKGATVDNLETAALTPDALWTGVQSLANQKAQDGDAGSHHFKNFLSCFNLYKTAKEVMNSSLIANSAENNLNVFDTDYGHVRIGASIFLNSAYNADSNAQTSYHLMSDDHQIHRKVFYGLSTAMVAPEYSDNDTWVIKAKFNEVAFPGSWTGYLGCTGAA